MFLRKSAYIFSAVNLRVLYNEMGLILVLKNVNKINGKLIRLYVGNSIKFPYF